MNRNNKGRDYVDRSGNTMIPCLLSSLGTTGLMAGSVPVNVTWFRVQHTTKDTHKCQWLTQLYLENPEKVSIRYNTTIDIISGGES